MTIQTVQIVAAVLGGLALIVVIAKLTFGPPDYHH